MGYSDIIATVAMIVSISAVPASGYLSYRYAIKGEKRKEWNAIAEPVIDYFWSSSSAHRTGGFYVINKLPINEITSLSRRFSSNETIAFTPLFSRYMEIVKASKSKALSDIECQGLLNEASEISAKILEIITIK